MGQDDRVKKGQNPDAISSESSFDSLLAHDKRNERRLLWSELGVAALVVFLVTAYLIVS
jgi:hypothetical protein